MKFSNKLKLNEKAGELQVFLDKIIDYIKNNRWKSFGIIFLSASITIFYVDNVFTINKLLLEKRHLLKQKQAVVFSIKSSERKMISLQSADRIVGIAQKKLSMSVNKKAPDYISE